MEVDIKVRQELKARRFLEMDESISPNINSKTSDQIYEWFQNNCFPEGKPDIDKICKVFTYLTLKLQSR